MQKAFIARVLPIALIVFVVVLVAGLAYPMLMEQYKTRDLRATFKEEDEALRPALKDLGISAEPKTYFQCNDEERTYVKTVVNCSNFHVHPYNTAQLDDKERQALPEKASNLDKLLQQRGWKPDRPQDRITTIAGANPFLPENNGQGATIPFHKNVPGGSCTLQIDIDGTGEGHHPGAVNVIQFSCSKVFSYPTLRVTQHRAVGP